MDQISEASAYKGFLDDSWAMYVRLLVQQFDVPEGTQLTFDGKEFSEVDSGGTGNETTN